MASNRIKGITIEIEGNTTKLSESLRQVDKNLKDTQSQLRDVNKLLKLDPKNTELLRQKQTLLKSAISDTKDKLDQEKDALKQLEAVKDPTPEMVKQQNALKREIADTEASLKSYNKQLDAMPSKLDAIASASKNVADKTKGVSALAGAGAFAIVGNAFNAAATADDLNTLARNTGIATDELQKMQYASALVDVSVDDMTGAYKRMVKAMGDGKDTFSELGVAITDQDGNLRSANDVWYETLEALSNISNETERDAKSMEIFGKSAMDLSGIIDDGGAALQEYGQQAQDAGLILSDDTLQAANQLNDQIDTLKATTTAAMLEAGAELATVLAPAIQGVVDGITQLITWFGSLDGSTQTAILTALALVAAISPLASLISGVATVIGLIASPVGIAVAAIATLIAIGVDLYNNWDTIKAKAGELWENITATFENIKSAISEKINDAKETVMNAVQKIKDAFNFEWSLPQIKLPHFSVSGGKAPWGFMGQGSLPSVSVQWYKKAYNNGLLFTKPTVMTTPYGLKGFGDGNGSELVIGTNTLMNMIEQSNEGQAAELARISGLLEIVVANGMNVTLQGDAQRMFKVMRQQNNKFRTSTGKSGFDY